MSKNWKGCSIFVHSKHKSSVVSFRCWKNKYVNVNWEKFDRIINEWYKILNMLYHKINYFKNRENTEKYLSNWTK